MLKTHKWLNHLVGEVHSLKERKGVGRASTADEENLLLARCATADSACYIATVLALNTTMRRDEIRRLQWQQVDLFEGTLKVGSRKQMRAPAGSFR